MKHLHIRLTSYGPPLATHAPPQKLLRLQAPWQSLGLHSRKKYCAKIINFYPGGSRVLNYNIYHILFKLILINFYIFNLCWNFLTLIEFKLSKLYLFRSLFQASFLFCKTFDTTTRVSVSRYQIGGTYLKILKFSFYICIVVLLALMQTLRYIYLSRLKLCLIKFFNKTNEFLSYFFSLIGLIIYIYIYICFKTSLLSLVTE